jgi:hypothetical protein
MCHSIYIHKRTITTLSWQIKPAESYNIGTLSPPSESLIKSIFLMKMMTAVDREIIAGWSVYHLN